MQLLPQCSVLICLYCDTRKTAACREKAAASVIRLYNVMFKFIEVKLKDRCFWTGYVCVCVYITDCKSQIYSPHNLLQNTWLTARGNLHLNCRLQQFSVQANVIAILSPRPAFSLLARHKQTILRVHLQTEDYILTAP